MHLDFVLYIRKKLTLSKRQPSKKQFVFAGTCHSSLYPSQCSNKSVHFSDSNSTIYYTYSSNDYDRGSYDIGDKDMSHHLWTDNGDLHVISPKNDNAARLTCNVKHDMNDYRTQQDMDFDDQCRRNTKINKKRGYRSVAVLVHYRSNF
ncbi:hypothetical protein BCR42DRAFT_423555 [Absidia repens]|uniref:Uncharacterized protein n=1 Tax=Absidia repens TaxID=90262 RepID=A0A1X2I526_9FUNG|nr:hypothetical protein BCR42DRAFT_423555 [Absidia repens]